MTRAVVDIDPDRPDRIAVWSDYRLKDNVKAVPGARWDGDKRRWHVPLSWPSCLALRAECGEFLEIQPDLREWATDTREMKDSLRELRGFIELPGGPSPEMEFLPGFEDLFPHQLVDAECIYLAGSYLLTNETGCGKSRGALAGLALIDHDKAVREPVFPMMIVCPKSMIRTWSREVDRFFPDAVVNECAGTPSVVKRALEPGADVYVIAWDTLRRYSRLASFPTIALSDEEKRDKEIQELKLQTVIADECHRAKNPRSARTRAFWQVAKGCEYRIGLTGTPIQDQPEDMWAVLHALFPDEYPTKTSYVERYLEVDYNRWGGREITGVHPSRKEEFFANLDACMRRVTKEMALPHLPPKVYETRWVQLPPALRKAYESMKAELIAELESGDTLTAKSVLERAGRLIQLANASGEIGEPPAPGEPAPFRMTAPSPKVDALIEDLLEGDHGYMDGESICVFSDSRQLIDILSEAMTAKRIAHVKITGDVTGDDRQDAMDLFQAGKVQVILITRAGGEGITLTAARTMIRLVRAWSYTVHAQAEDRVHRIGSEIHDSIKIVDYVTEDTVEEAQMVRLSGKEARAQEVLRDAELLAMLRS